MSDLISREAAINALAKLPNAGIQWYISFENAMYVLENLPTVEPEPLTDKEQRIFLAAMGREEKICKQVDEECRNCREPYEDSLVIVCKEITRKVKGALWT